MVDNEIINYIKLFIETNEVHDFIINDYILDHTKSSILSNYQKSPNFFSSIYKKYPNKRSTETHFYLAKYK